MPKCNKCGRDGLSWSKKTLKDDKVINILLEADGSEHRPYKDGEAKCNPTTQEKKVVDTNQQKLPEAKANINDNIQKILEIDDLIHVNAKHQCAKQYKPLFQNDDLITAEIELLKHKERQLLEIARSKLVS